jgi:outer membrane protein assembly factor BamB
MRTPRMLAPAVIATLGLVLVGATNAPSDDWRQSGFDAQHTRFNPFETTLTRSNVGHLTPAFAAPVQTGPDPVVVGGTAYLSSSGAGDVQALDAGTGSVRWTANACNQGQQTSAPAFAMGAIWVGLNDPSIVGLASSSGATRTCVSPGDLFPTPPSAANGAVYAGGGSGEVVAVDASSGRVRWGVWPPSPLLAPLMNAPAVSTDGTRLFVGSSNGYVYKLAAGAQGTYAGLAAFNASTGSRVWSSNEFVQDPPTVANDVVYVDAEFTLDMFNSSTGALLGRVTTLPAGYAYQGSAIPAGGRVYLWSDRYLDGTGGRLEALRP